MTTMIKTFGYREEFISHLKDKGFDSFLSLFDQSGQMVVLS